MVVTRVILVWGALSLAAGAEALANSAAAIAGGNALAAAGKFDTRAGVKVVLSLALPGQSAVSGRFSIPAKK